MTSYRGGAVVLASSLALVLSLGLALAATAREGEGKHGKKDAGECEESTFPATGQTAPYGAITADPGTAVSDDGTVRAGGRLRYRDNGDGTITDLNTRLMWEKKSLDGGLHDVNSSFDWSLAFSNRTIWDWLADVNAEVGTGFAGHNDWRIPNVRELQSIVDYGRFNPAVDPVFNNGAFAGCTVRECSNTAASFGPPVYLSSTTHALFTGGAWFVDLTSGLSAATGKGVGFFVRAVRGGCVPTGDEDDRRRERRW